MVIPVNKKQEGAEKAKYTYKNSLTKIAAILYHTWKDVKREQRQKGPEIRGKPRPASWVKTGKYAL